MSLKHTAIALIATVIGTAGFTGAGIAVGYIMHMQNSCVAQTTVSQPRITTQPSQPQFLKSVQRTSSRSA